MSSHALIELNGGGTVDSALLRPYAEALGCVAPPSGLHLGAVNWQQCCLYSRILRSLVGSGVGQRFVAERERLEK